MLAGPENIPIFAFAFEKNLKYSRTRCGSSAG